MDFASLDGFTQWEGSSWSIHSEESVKFRATICAPLAGLGRVNHSIFQGTVNLRPGVRTMRGFIAKAILLGLATASFADNPSQTETTNKSAQTQPTEPIPAAKRAADRSAASKDASAPKAKGLVARWTSMKKVFSADENETLSVEATSSAIKTPSESTLANISQAEPLPPGEAPPTPTTVSDIAMSDNHHARDPRRPRGLWLVWPTRLRSLDSDRSETGRLRLQLLHRRADGPPHADQRAHRTNPHRRSQHRS